MRFSRRKFIWNALKPTNTLLALHSPRPTLAIRPSSSASRINSRRVSTLGVATLSSSDRSNMLIYKAKILSKLRSVNKLRPSSKNSMIASTWPKDPNRLMKTSKIKPLMAIEPNQILTVLSNSFRMLPKTWVKSCRSQRWAATANSKLICAKLKSSGSPRWR